jgi:hypothetical protein
VLSIARRSAIVATGCWRVDGSAADARLSFVALVVNAEPQ